MFADEILLDTSCDLNEFIDSELAMLESQKPPILDTKEKDAAALDEVTVPTINEHMANLYAQGEISPEATLRNFRTVQIYDGDGLQG